MARIAGIDIPENKKTNIALSYIYGIGRPLAERILISQKIDLNKKTKDLTSDELNRIRDFIEKSFKVEGELRREIMLNIKRLKDIGSYRGMRHAKRLPVRGQHTRKNTRTIRGNVRKTVGSGRKKAAEKT